MLALIIYQLPSAILLVIFSSVMLNDQFLYIRWDTTRFDLISDRHEERNSIRSGYFVISARCMKR